MPVIQYRPYAHDVIWVGRPRLEVKRRLFTGQSCAPCIHSCESSIVSSSFYNMAAWWRPCIWSIQTSIISFVQIPWQNIMLLNKTWPSYQMTFSKRLVEKWFILDTSGWNFMYVYSSENLFLSHNCKIMYFLHFFFRKTEQTISRTLHISSARKDNPWRVYRFRDFASCRFRSSL